MADNMCGPSNAFKGLAQHVDRDRSLQQDRFTSGPQGPGQSFHSTHPANGAADQNFSTFQGGNASLAGFAPGGPDLPVNAPASHHHASIYAPWPSFPPQHAAPVPNAGSDWVSDFNRQMSLNGQPSHAGANPALPMANFPTMAPGPMHPPFHFPFAQMKESPPAHVSSPRVPWFPTPELPQSAPQEVQETAPLVYPTDRAALDRAALDRAALDAEFEREMDAWMAVHGPQAEVGSGAQVEESDTAEQATTAPAEAYQADDQDTIPAAEQAEFQEQSDTELARAAQQLVDSVSDNTSDKFKNSSFLALMRRIAAKELVVQGNDLVETSQAPVLESEPSSQSHIAGQTSTTSPAYQ
ncbi:hypothetical protein F4779DRAFT_312592 [Xylariaceae sp. FL0662B]|nr:hypothetical protein F4779DRAFT_312592 [Xylariaceae sp. FL0662B]